MIRDKMEDSQFSYDALTDLANEHGDQAVIENVLAWLHDKMSGEWLITKKEQNNEKCHN